MQQDATEEFGVRCGVKARERKAAREENKEATAAKVSLPEGAPPPEHPGTAGNLPTEASTCIGLAKVSLYSTPFFP